MTEIWAQAALKVLAVARPPVDRFGSQAGDAPRNVRRSGGALISTLNGERT